MARRRCFEIGAGDGKRLHVVEYGPARDDRLPILCLPGLVRSSRDFRLFARRLGENRRIVCPDYRGRGLSERESDGRRYGPQSDLGDILHIRAARQIDRAVVVGTSYGGLMAMALGAVAPTMLAGVVLNDIGPEPAQESYRALLEAIDGDRVLDSWDQAPDALRAMLPALKFQTEELFGIAARNTWREGADGRLHVDWDPALVRNLRRAPPPEPLWPLFTSLRKVPGLLLRGAQSDILTRSCFDRMAAEKSDLVCIEVPGTGHAPTLEEPQARDAIDDFLARL